MSNLPFYAFYPGKWLGRTATLTAQERGVFITLICEMYERMEPIEYDAKPLSRLCGCTPKTLEKVVTVLAKDKQKIIIENGRLWNGRVQKEIEKSQKKSEISKINARARWDKTQQKQLHDYAAALPLECYPEPEPDIHPPDSLPLSSNNSVSAKKNGVKKGGDSFEASRWFSATDIETYERLHPDLPIATKLADADFKDWCFKKNKADPQRPARQWIDNEQTKQDGFNGLKGLSVTADDCKPSASLLNSKLVKSR